jgi:ATP-binding cassette subfamily E protein 1
LIIRVFSLSLLITYCSYKPQKISPKFQGTVRQLLHKKIRDAYIHPQFVSDVMRPMSMDPIMDNGVQTLSGGELQRVAIVLCLGTPADIYLVSNIGNRANAAA